jgi:uncharacterized protein YbcC (UPF0753/DUF2309 family)
MAPASITQSIKSSPAPMKGAIAMPANDDFQIHDLAHIEAAVAQSWKNIAPLWPLKNIIAVNPLNGLEDQPIEEAMIAAQKFFQHQSLPTPMSNINRESIKWLQAFFDEDQASLAMPMRALGLWASWRQCAVFDDTILKGDAMSKSWLHNLPDDPNAVIAHCLHHLDIDEADHALFLTLMLTSLAGWAGFVQYRCSWSHSEPDHPFPVTQADYLAMRLVITALLWPDAKALLNWHHDQKTDHDHVVNLLDDMAKNERIFQQPLINQLVDAAQANMAAPPQKADAQLVFCIDVRSEPFRQSLEAVGDFETYGFAGFFGLPISVEDSVSGHSHASCPVLLTPQHQISELPDCTHQTMAQAKQGYERLSLVKRFYQTLKYNFTTPFLLAEALGFVSGFSMSLRNFMPKFATKLKQRLKNRLYAQTEPAIDLSDLSLEQQIDYGYGALTMMGLTDHFAPLIVLCGHGSETQNNAYATSLDCGACGGRHGGSNARALAKILNNPEVREGLKEKGITLPESSYVIGAEHNTTNDHVVLYDQDAIISKGLESNLRRLQKALHHAGLSNSYKRAQTMGYHGDYTQSAAHVTERSQGWSQTRPEWGLARNAAFIIAPRALTYSMDLGGRCFLHSYDYTIDKDSSALTTILTAPMVVTQWINNQYLLSTLDPVAFGGGSKVTKNITGKIGIMQGNASDLMLGLPLQSVYSDDETPYHEPLRLLSLVYAPRSKIDPIIKEQAVLQKLLGNGWVQLGCIDPETQKAYLLQRDFSWQDFSREEQ